MKLDYACVDAILLYVEENQNVFLNKDKMPAFYDTSKVYISDLIAALKDQYADEFSVYYAVQFAYQTRLIDCELNSVNKSLTNIIGITPHGHDRLSHIHKEKSEAT